MFTDITHLQRAIRQGYTDWQKAGRVNVTRYHDLLLFDYSAACQYGALEDWNWFELNSRGLILNAQTGDIVARPFEKIFNYGQRLPNPNTRIVEITDKWDGSLGILAFWDEDWHISTRGSFTSDQALEATKMLHEDYSVPLDAADWTYLFEIVYPENRIVVNYDDLRCLCLIGARHMRNGHYKTVAQLDMIADKHLFDRPAHYVAQDELDLLALAKIVDANHEGWVLRYNDGLFLKIKSDAYVLAHRLITNVTPKRVAQAMLDGTLDSMLAGIPDEFLGAVRIYEKMLNAMIYGTIGVVDLLMQAAPPKRDAPGDAKTFALWVAVTIEPELRSLMFSARAGKDLRPQILKTLIKEGIDEPEPIG